MIESQMRELICFDCGATLGAPIQSNIDRHTAMTGHKDIKDREATLDDGTVAKAQGETFIDEHNLTEEMVQARQRQEFAKLKQEEETAMLKKQVPSKKEQKEIEKLVEEKNEGKSSKR